MCALLPGGILPPLSIEGLRTEWPRRRIFGLDKGDLTSAHSGSEATAATVAVQTRIDWADMSCWARRFLVLFSDSVMFAWLAAGLLG